MLSKIRAAVNIFLARGFRKVVLVIFCYESYPPKCTCIFVRQRIFLSGEGRGIACFFLVAGSNACDGSGVANFVFGWTVCGRMPNYSFVAGDTVKPM